MSSGKRCFISDISFLTAADKDWKEKGLDGTVEENMTLCVESFIGPEGSGEGVRFEEQLLVTATGTKMLSMFPREDDLLA